MGRAIVREPSVFLMDEPLSNLDAKLRVQMRTEVLRIQRRLGVATLYVTHDQTEAMTMGDRVAVIHAGLLQQLASPQELYDRPANLCRRFIGSPAMNLYEASVAGPAERLVVRSAPRSSSSRPRWGGESNRALRCRGSSFIVGIRPEHLTVPTAGSQPQTGTCLQADVELVEALGNELLVHFATDATTAHDEVSAASPDEVAPVGGDGIRGTPLANGVARVDPRTPVSAGERVTFSVDLAAAPLFRPADRRCRRRGPGMTGKPLADGASSGSSPVASTSTVRRDRDRSTRMRPRCRRTRRGAAMPVARRPQAGGDDPGGDTPPLPGGEQPTTDCVGLIVWMHTFSPAKMWIAGPALQKPLLHLHTQFNRGLPWAEIDMDFMNLNQSAHGDREHGYLNAAGLAPTRQSPATGRTRRSSSGSPAGRGRRAAGTRRSDLKVARFGDNMRQVAVTEGDKVEAQMRLGFTVNGYGVGDLVDAVRGCSDEVVERLVREYEEAYDLVPELLPAARGAPRSSRPRGSRLGCAPSSRTAASARSPTPSRTSTGSPNSPGSPRSASWPTGTDSAPRATGRPPRWCGS